MIKIEKNKIVPENPNLRVLSPSGDYTDNDYILCSPVDNPDFALCAFSASFIKYGSIVNQFNDPLELGEALIKIDPDCTHDTALLFKEEEIRKLKREKGDFTPENPVPFDETLNEQTLEKALEDTEQQKDSIEDQIQKAKDNIKKLDEESTLSNDTSTTSIETSTSTPPVENPTSSTSTPITEVPEVQATSTEPVLPDEVINPSTDIPIQTEEIPVIIPPSIEEVPAESPLSILTRKNKRNIT